MPAIEPLTFATSAVENPDWLTHELGGFLWNWGGKAALARLVITDGLTHNLSPLFSRRRNPSPNRPSPNRPIAHRPSTSVRVTVACGKVSARCTTSPSSMCPWMRRHLAIRHHRPISSALCCNCDRIRLRSGKWVDDQTPSSGERRTHGLCPDCFAKLYPEFTDLGVR